LLVADAAKVRPWLQERALPALALFGIGGIVPGASLHAFGGTPVNFTGNVHFIGVGISALAAAFAAVALTVAGSRRRDARAVLVGTAFTAMAALLAIHGLATPGILIGDNGVIAFTGAATLPIGAAVLALSALPALRRPEAIRRLLVLQSFGLAAVITLGALGMLIPSLVPSVPAPRSPVAWAGLGVGVAFFLVLATRAFKTYRLTRRTADLIVVVGIFWLTAALPPAMLMNYSELGWWLGHCFELFGIVLVGSAVAGDLRRSSQSRPLAGDLRAPELVAAEEAFLGGRVRSLMVLLAEKDTSTEEHTRRVALRAVQVGEQLGLAPGRLRSLAIGGLLHDIGKLSIPQGILKKPAPLDDSEYTVIRKHPEWGDKLMGELGGFADSVRDLVRNHHERLDGCGYPRGLTADELDLDTRILTVCDVYDALITPRVYRPAWTHEQALELLRKDTGGAFDRRCVEALVQVLEREHVREPAVLPPARAAYA
jgi:HD-GYP domain-containing protein (c-di-GMP phosphodiesterase class II)